MHIASLHIYPIKSCRGHAVDSVEVDRLGPVDDRRLMLVDSQGRFLSQREVPRLATVVPELGDRVLCATAPTLEAFRMALSDDGPLRSVSVWGSTGLQAVDQGDLASAWFSEAIGHSCRLVRFGSATRNPVDPEFSPRADAETSFTDGYPLLAVTEASLADLNARLAEPVPMTRFRPSVVVGGTAPWGEDAWQAMQFGDLVMDAVKPCARCVILTTDQSTGVRHATQEPLRTLASFRNRPGLGAIFGQNMVPRGTGLLRVGDPVRSA